ncbi:hypothetical protein BH10PSE15_BH10PSE15_16200 [soil metagenome]
MVIEDMIDLARRSRERAERAMLEEAFWQNKIAEHRIAEAERAPSSDLIATYRPSNPSA